MITQLEPAKPAVTLVWTEEPPIVRFPPLPETFERFYRREVRPLSALAYALTGDVGVAEHLAQRTLAAIRRRWDVIEAADQPARQARRVILRRSVSPFQRTLAKLSRRFRGGLFSGATHDREAFDAETFWREVRALPARQQHVVALTQVEGSPPREVAAVLGISQSAAIAHLDAALAVVAERLVLEVRP